MSNFDPKSPSYVPPGNVIDTGDSFVVHEGNQTAQTLLAMADLTTGTSVAVVNAGCRGAMFPMRINTYPASASTSVALKLQTTDVNTSSTWTFANRAALSAAGASFFMVYPGLSASAGGVSSVLPKDFYVRVSISSAATNGTVTMSLSMMRIV